MAGMFDAVGHIEGAMTFHRDRHAVLAGNVANLDTPGYRPIDLERDVAMTDGTGVAITTTNASHLTTAGTTAGEPSIAIDDGGALQGADGNAVNLERELSKIDANRVRYNTSSELVSRRLALLKYAASDGAL
jgi:flagellar basal-body rod protein FlgB